MRRLEPILSSVIVVGIPLFAAIIVNPYYLKPIAFWFMFPIATLYIDVTRTSKPKEKLSFDFTKESLPLLARSLLLAVGFSILFYLIGTYLN